MHTRRSRGFTLVEVLISLLIAGIIGGALTKLLVSQNRYYDHETNLRTARGIARSASNVLLADLRMVQANGGVDLVAPDGKLIRILVPYRFGMICGSAGNKTTVSMLPIDSGTSAVSVYRGFAWRDPVAATYTYELASPGNLPSSAGDPAVCTGNAAGQSQIRTIDAAKRPGSIFDLQMSSPSVAPPTVPVFFFQRITYSFAPSLAYPNRLGLWRNVEGATAEELMAPFDASARFRFYTSGSDVSTIAPPPISAISGLELVLAARSPRAISNDPTGAVSTVVTSVFFKNVLAF